MLTYFVRQVCGFANSVIILLKTLTSSLFLKLGKLVSKVIVTAGKEIPDLWNLSKNRELFHISSAVMYAIVVGSSGAIAMNMV